MKKLQVQKKKKFLCKMMQSKKAYLKSLRDGWNNCLIKVENVGCLFLSYVVYMFWLNRLVRKE